MQSILSQKGICQLKQGLATPITLPCPRTRVNKEQLPQRHTPILLLATENIGKHLAYVTSSLPEGLSWTVWTCFVRYVSHAKLGQRVCQIMNSPCTLNGYNPRNDTEQHLWPHAPARCSSENLFMEILLAMRKFQVCQCCQCVGAVTTCQCSTKEQNTQTRKTCPS